MKLRAKFNLAVIAAFLVGFAAAGALLQEQFLANAREQVLQNARIMMSAANAVRSYTDKMIAPVTPPQLNGRFLAVTVPSFAAQTTFKAVQKNFADYSYREPTLNPTNPTDRPADWEADLINDFRNHPGETEIVGERDTPTGPSLSLARPIAVHDAQCLECHSEPARAPAAMVQTYGSANGFGWHLNDVVGAQVVSVPMAVAMADARSAFMAFMAVLGGMFVLVLVILNVLLHFTVIRPAVRLARIANAVSLGETNVEEYERKGSDEIAILAAAFNRMRRSLDSAMRLLER